jgi:hypothetical protein
MLGGLRTVFADVARRRARHELDTLSMGEVAARELDRDLAATAHQQAGVVTDFSWLPPDRSSRRR